MKLSQRQLSTILHALYLAEQWEDSVIDSLSPALVDPIFRKQRDEAIQRREEFKALRLKLRGPGG